VVIPAIVLMSIECLLLYLPHLFIMQKPEFLLNQSAAVITLPRGCAKLITLQSWQSRVCVSWGKV